MKVSVRTTHPGPGEECSEARRVRGNVDTPMPCSESFMFQVIVHLSSSALCISSWLLFACLSSTHSAVRSQVALWAKRVISRAARSALLHTRPVHALRHSRSADLRAFLVEGRQLRCSHSVLLTLLHNTPLLVVIRVHAIVLPRLRAFERHMMSSCHVLGRTIDQPYFGNYLSHWTTSGDVMDSVSSWSRREENLGFRLKFAHWTSYNPVSSLFKLW